jgi:hypothetical protein
MRFTLSPQPFRGHCRTPEDIEWGNTVTIEDLAGVLRDFTELFNCWAFRRGKLEAVTAALSLFHTAVPHFCPDKIIFGLTGPTGSGKSKFMALFCGGQHPDLCMIDWATYQSNYTPAGLYNFFDGSTNLMALEEFTADALHWMKDFFNRLGASLVGSFLNVKTTDLTCGFRAHSRETLLRLNNPTGFTYTQETIIDAIGKNLRVLWVPIHVTYFANRQSKIVKSVYSFVNNSARIIVKAVRDVRPMKFFGIPGLVLIALALLSFLIFLFQYFSHGLKVTPYLNYLLFSSVTFLIGMQLLIFSFVADMIKTSRRITEDLAYSIKKDKYHQKS